MNTYERHRFPRLRAPQTSSRMPSGSAIASILASVILMIFWLNGVLPSAENQSASGASNSVGAEPRKIVTDKLRSDGVAHRELIPEAIHSTKHENNRVEQSHEATGLRERGLRRFKSMGQAQRFVSAHAAVFNLFNLGRHLVRAKHYRDLRMSAFTERSRTVA